MQNKNMQKLFYIFSFILSALLFSAMLPYPIFSNHTNIPESVAYEINNFHEIEISNSNNKATKILPLQFEIIDSILPVNAEFEIYDMASNISFFAKRTGGQFHLDIEPTDEINASILKEIVGDDWTWERRAALVKINDFIFVPSSFCAYPHGYETLRTINGHLCLHFYGSKTDGTNEEDAAHQKSVKYAQNHGKKLLKNLEESL